MSPLPSIREGGRTARTWPPAPCLRCPRRCAPALSEPLWLFCAVFTGVSRYSTLLAYRRCNARAAGVVECRRGAPTRGNRRTCPEARHWRSLCLHCLLLIPTLRCSGTPKPSYRRSRSRFHLSRRQSRAQSWTRLPTSAAAL